MRLATIRTGTGTTAARLDGDVLIPLDATDVGQLLAEGGDLASARARHRLQAALAAPARQSRPATAPPIAVPASRAPAGHQRTKRPGGSGARHGWLPERAAAAPIAGAITH